MYLLLIFVSFCRLFWHYRYPDTCWTLVFRFVMQMPLCLNICKKQKTQHYNWPCNFVASTCSVASPWMQLISLFFPFPPSFNFGYKTNHGFKYFETFFRKKSHQFWSRCDSIWTSLTFSICAQLSSLRSWVGEDFEQLSSDSVTWLKWMFPKIVVPPNHPF